MMDGNVSELCPVVQDSGWSFSQREPANARDRILVAASQLFCHHGFAATGVDSIIAEAGTAKATLYKHFSSKDDLICAVLDVEGAAWRRWFFGKLSRVEGNARTRMLALFDVLYDWFNDDSFYGCPFINAVAEFDTGNSAIRDAAAQHKVHLVTWLTANAIEMGAEDPQEVCRTMVVLVDGAIVAAQHSRDPSFAKVAGRAAAVYLNGIGHGA